MLSMGRKCAMVKVKGKSKKENNGGIKIMCGQLLLW